MAASYQVPMAGGVTELGRFDPFDLYGQSGDKVTTQLQAKDAQAIGQLVPVSVMADGRYQPWTGFDLYAHGTYTFSGQPAAADTITINAHAITFRASGAVANEVNIGPTLRDTLNNVAALINAAAPSYYAVGAGVEGTGNIITLVALTAGTAGDTIATTAASSVVTVSGATLTDSTAAQGEISNNATAICVNAIAAATPGAWFSAFVSGQFSDDAIAWPSGVVSLGQRKAAFAGTPISIFQLL